MASATGNADALPKLKPREGGGAALVKWRFALSQWADARGIDITLRIPQDANSYTDYGSTPPSWGGSVDADVILKEALEYWQAENNALWEHVLPSLVLDGPHLEDDLETIRQFAQPPRRSSW